MKYDDKIMDRWPQSEDTPTELKIGMFGVISKMKDLFRIFRKCGNCRAFGEIDGKAKAFASGCWMQTRRPTNCRSTVPT